MSTRPNITISQRLAAYNVQWRQPLLQLKADLRVAEPAIIKSFDASKQTVSVQLAIQERFLKKGKIVAENADLISDVPIVLPRAGGFALTMPIQVGDECLVVFGDRCIDDWWQAGGIGKQLTGRLHDPSDAMAIVGIWSQPHVLPNYNTSSAELRSADGSIVITMATDSVNLQVGSTSLTVTNGMVLVDGGSFSTTNGASGTFESKTDQLITVQGGIVTGIE